MLQRKTVTTEGLVSDDRFQAWLSSQIHRVLHVERAMTRDELANAAGITTAVLDAIRRSDGGRRKVGAGVALSLCYALGDGAVNGMLAQIGYGGAARIDDVEEGDIRSLLADVLPGLSVIGDAARDGRIDHIEQPLTQKAADDIIARLIPLSSLHKH
ncbi:UNVERIFIED_ORG: DNA-binding Xre family transcriptional regulator [Sphingomonas sp. R1F5B]